MLGLLLVLLSVGLLIHAARRARSVPLAVLAGTFTVFYGIRAVGIALNLDDPFPAYLFSSTDLESEMARFGLVLVAFCGALVFLHSYAGFLARPIEVGLPYARDRLRTGPLLVVVVVTTAVAGLIALSVVAGVGGLEQAVATAKSGREGGSTLLRIPATIALVLSCGAFHRARQAASGAAARNGQVTAGFCALIAALSASVWGSRQFIVVAAAYLLGAPVFRAFRDAQKGWLLRALLVSLLVVGIGFGLRLYRDDALGGETTVSQAEGHLFRQVSVSANGIMYDSSLLAVRDWPAKFAWRGGDDFANGLWASLPGPLRPEGGTASETVGAAFHKIYEPSARNGWPVGAPTEWYINFGWLGVLLGGGLTGLLYRALTNAHARSKEPELAVIASIVMAIIVFPLGLAVTSPIRFVVHVVPLTLTLLVLAGMSHGAGKDREGRRARRALSG